MSKCISGKNYSIVKYGENTYKFYDLHNGDVLDSSDRVLGEWLNMFLIGHETPSTDEKIHYLMEEYYYSKLEDDYGEACMDIVSIIRNYTDIGYRNIVIPGDNLDYSKDTFTAMRDTNGLVGVVDYSHGDLIIPPVIISEENKVEVLADRYVVIPGIDNSLFGYFDLADNCFSDIKYTYTEMCNLLKSEK